MNEAADTAQAAPPASSRAQLSEYSLRNFFIATAVVAVTIFGAAWPWSYYGRLWFMDPEWAMWTAKLQMLESCELGDTIIIGDSRAMAGLIPTELEGQSTNLAVGGGTAIESYYIARRAMACPNPPKRVIMPLLAIDISRENSLYWERTARFNFLSFSEMEEVRKAALSVSDSHIYSSNRIGTIFDFAANVSHTISLPSYYTAAMANAMLVGRKARNEQELKLTFQTRGQRYFGTEPRSDLPGEDATQRRFSPNALLAYYLDRLLVLLREKNVEVYLVTPPLNPATFHKLSPGVVAAFKDYVGDVARKHPNFHPLGDLVYQWPAENFGDPEHLNERGAVIWSRKVKDWLAQASK